MGIFKEKCSKCWELKPCKCDKELEENPTTPQSTGAKIFTPKCPKCWDVPCQCKKIKK